MKKFFAVLTVIFVLAISATVFAETPTCVMLKFTNDTRFKNIDSAAVLSDLVMEKILASGKFNLQETTPIAEDIEAMLYDEKQRDVLNAEASIRSGNFNILFESGTFDAKHAQSVATAEVGQIVSPDITSTIGRNHGAEYLIQGTIINLGNGKADSRNNVLGIYGGQTGVKTSAIGVVADVRIIKASTGEVIWNRTATGTKKNSLVQVGVFKFGSTKLNAEMYNTAMERTAQEIVDGLLEDLEAGKLFVK